MSLEGAIDREVTENDINKLNKEIMRQKLEENKYEEMLVKGLPDGMGNSIDRAENFPQEVKALQQEFNQKQKEVDDLNRQAEEARYELIKANETQPQASAWDVAWEGLRKQHGDKSVMSGIYLYRMQTQNFSQIKRMILLK